MKSEKLMNFLSFCLLYFNFLEFINSELKSTTLRGIIDETFSLKTDDDYVLYTFPLARTNVDYLYINITGNFTYSTKINIYFNENDNLEIITGDRGNYGGNTVFSENLRDGGVIEFSKTTDFQKGYIYILVYLEDYENRDLLAEGKIFSVYTYTDCLQIDSNNPTLFKINDNINELLFYIPPQNVYKYLLIMSSVANTPGSSDNSMIYLSSNKNFSENIQLLSANYILQSRVALVNNIPYYIKFRITSSIDISKILFELTNYEEIQLMQYNEYYTFNSIEIYKGYWSSLSAGFNLYYSYNSTNSTEDLSKPLYLALKVKENLTEENPIKKSGFSIYYSETTLNYQDLDNSSYNKSSLEKANVFEVAGDDIEKEEDIDFQYFIKIERNSQMKGLRILLQTHTINYPDKISIKIVRLKEEPKTSSTGAIVGGTCGGGAALAALIYLIYRLKNK